MKRIQHIQVGILVIILVVLLTQANSASAGKAVRSIDGFYSGLDVGQHNSLVLDKDEFPVIAYYDKSLGDLKLVHCNDYYCTGSESIVTLDSTNNVGQYASLKLDANGNPVISYWDASAFDLKLIHCDDPNCTGVEIPVIVQSDGPVGSFSSLELDANGRPVISYYSATAGDLMLVHCDDPNCAGVETAVTVDAAGFVGTYSSLELDANGNPVIAYFDFSAKDLKVAHCTDPNCSGAKSLTYPDTTTAEIGGYITLVLDQFSRPAITYYSMTHQSVKYLNCDDPNCTGSELTFFMSSDPNGPYSSIAVDDAGYFLIAYEDNASNLMITDCDATSCGNSWRFPGRAQYISMDLARGYLPVVSYYDPVYGDLELAALGKSVSPADFNGDDISEVTVFRNGAWFMYNYSNNNLLTSIWTGQGGSGAIPVMMDLTGDGSDELTVYSAGAWHIFQDDGSYAGGVWTGGQPGSVPVAGDYDGDGLDDFVIFDHGAWHFFDTLTGEYLPERSVWTGTGTGSKPIPVAVDWDGDGAENISIFNEGGWILFTNGGSFVGSIWTGMVNGIPVPGDYDGDSKDDLVVFQNGAWQWFDLWVGFVPEKSVFTGVPAHKYGGVSMPAPLDIDGDEDLDFAIYAGGPWYFYNTTGALVKFVPTGGVLGDKDVSTRPAIP